MQKITILTQYFHPEKGATSQLITDLAKGLSHLGYAVNIFTGAQSQQATPESLLNQIHINRALSPIKSSTSILSKIGSSFFFLIGAVTHVTLHQTATTPLLIASNPPYAGILGIYFKLLKRGKYYVLLQDIFPESAVMSGIMQPNSILFKLFNKLIYLTCKNSENTIVLSSSMQAYLEQKYPDIKTKIKIIENWAIEDIPICKKQDNKFAQTHNLTEMFTVLYSGNLGRLHDIETITEAAKILKDEPIKFVFIGDGAKTKIVKQAIENYQLKNILLLPYQPRELLPLSLTACDISLVSLIPGAESIVAPSKLYGMLAAGRGIISISVPNSYIDKLLTNSGSGVNVSPDNPQQLADIIRQLASDSQRVKSMGEIARQLYENRYTFKRALEEYEKLLF
ncbi:glycosyltransferase family 4 protein [Dolichospermum sp. ST_sed1]|nr:glycosyltransferase family 4 protein [Dolichospermum sp. ST_sed1]MDD1425523.1 glycosyltransferase family 4 protein [Dolichospermum sp. ST_sed9]MDD1432190.1 glycosyltransferase family 4 protein [Dolichospermum sp. ST_sed6]MDD1441524.1 glycosyltransferase family 4 protein [Dolichospermum sp. ST_sed3]MDD1447584.1 glycosyltransferase family 4 protein [Dolichospermum sp. ST_sed8]MDD1455675.1 glycosyltransferase family 4 protein [Dolichospermum sp. ST_sed7]MDD1460493.1 glycosyltransferase family